MVSWLAILAQELEGGECLRSGKYVQSQSLAYGCVRTSKRIWQLLIIGAGWMGSLAMNGRLYTSDIGIRYAVIKTLVETWNLCGIGLPHFWYCSLQRSYLTDRIHVFKLRCSGRIAEIEFIKFDGSTEVLNIGRSEAMQNLEIAQRERQRTVQLSDCLD